MSIDDLNYYNDPRVIAGEKGSRLFEIVTKNDAMTGHYLIGDDEFAEEIGAKWSDKAFEFYVEVALHYEVCPTCEGKGHHVNPSIDANGLTASDFEDDPDFRREYMSGTYDVQCYGCKGLRVVPEIDWDKVNPKVREIIEKIEKADAEYAAISRAERAMGA
jgi:hypothetical protein